MDEDAPGAKEQHFDVDLRQSKGAGDFGYGEVLHVSEPEDLELERGQVLSGPVPEVVDELAVHQGLVAGAGRFTGLLEGGGRWGLASEVIHPLVAGQGVEPGQPGPLGIVTVQLTVSCHEGFLGQIVCSVRIMTAGVEVLPDALVMPPDQLVERGRVALAGCQGQVRVGWDGIPGVHGGSRAIVGVFGVLCGHNACGLHLLNELLDRQGQVQADAALIAFHAQGSHELLDLGLLLECQEADQTPHHVFDLGGHLFADGFQGQPATQLLGDLRETQGHQVGLAEDGCLGIVPGQGAAAGHAHEKCVLGHCRGQPGVGGEVRLFAVEDVQRLDEALGPLAEENNAALINRGVGASGSFGGAGAFVVHPVMNGMAAVGEGLMVIGALRQGGQLGGVHVGVHQQDSVFLGLGDIVKGQAMKRGAWIEAEHGLERGQFLAMVLLFQFGQEVLAEGGLPERVQVEVQDPGGFMGHVGRLERGSVGFRGGVADDQGTAGHPANPAEVSFHDGIWMLVAGFHFSPLITPEGPGWLQGRLKEFGGNGFGPGLRPEGIGRSPPLRDGGRAGRCSGGWRLERVCFWRAGLAGGAALVLDDALGHTPCGWGAGNDLLPAACYEGVSEVGGWKSEAGPAVLTGPAAKGSPVLHRMEA